MLKLYNSLTRKKEEFRPQNPPEVKMYTCGVTVYDDCHIGHARSLYVFEVIRQYLKYKGFNTRFIRNITDIDDKIINRAMKLDIDWVKMVGRCIDSYDKDLENLGVGKADEEPRATENIQKMINHVEDLISKNYAYVTNSGVYFSVRKFKDYGKLSGQNIDGMRNNIRIEADEAKEDPLDFALWKKAKQGEPYWNSPWGEGRPGWHIECSAMARKYLGDTLDIHGGGRDLIFPHHENEIAQSEALTGKPFAKYWLHHGLLTINGQKMSKSLGNFVTLKEALNKYSSDVLKILYLSSHYRSPLDFNNEKMAEVLSIKSRIEIILSQLKNFKENVTLKEFSYPEFQLLYNKFTGFMNDDFNMPGGFSVIFEIISLVNRKQFTESLFFTEAKTLLYKILDIFVLSKEGPHKIKIAKEEIEEKISLREKLRKAKKFGEADIIRKELENKGVILEDREEGTCWRPEFKQ